MAGNDVKVDVSLDTKQAEKDAEGFKGKMAQVFGDMGKIAGGIFMAQVGGALASQGVETLKSSITLARDFNEIQSKSNTIFGESAAAINAWSKTASTSFGQSRAQALDAASSFGNMFSQLGIGSQTAADMSVKMTELASDFASFHNADITEVLTAQQAAFRGEYDALQKFVPTINAAAVQTKALAMTGKENADALTQQEKAAATYQLMLDGAGAAQGDFQRTSDSLANQQRILSAQWQDLQVKIGQVLIPALTAIVVAINTQVIPAVKAFAEDVKRYYESDIKPAIDNLKAAWETLAPIIIPILTLIIEHWKQMAKDFALTIGIIVDLISGDWSGAWDKFQAIVKGGVEYMQLAVNTILDILQKALSPLENAAKALGSAMADGMSGAFDWVIGHITSVINTLIDGYNNTIGSLPGASKIGKIGGGGSSGYGAPVPGGDDDQLPGREVFGQGAGGGSVAPTGAYGIPLEWTGSAWQQPGTTAAADIAAAYKNGTYQTPILQTVQLVVDGQVLAEAVTRHLARAM